MIRSSASPAPAVGMLCWEAGKVLEGLVQLEELVGNSTNPATFPFPLRYERIEGACYETVVERPSRQVLERMVAASQEMEAQGVVVITTSCGFNAIFQRELAAAVKATVITSALLWLPMLLATAAAERKIGVITAQRHALSERHFSAVGVESVSRVAIAGLDGGPEWRRIHDDPRARLDLPRFEKEVLSVARTLAGDEPSLAALVLECTDLPPFAAKIRQATGLPVYDLVGLVHAAVDACRLTARERKP